MASPLPTVLVDTDAAGESKIITFLAEVKAYLEQDLGNASLAITDADVKHGSRTTYYHASAGTTLGAVYNAGTLGYWQSAAGADTVTVPLELAVNERITAVSFYGRANAVTAWSWKLYKQNLLTGVVTQVGATQTSAIAAAISKMPIASLTETIAADTVYWAEWTGGAAGNRAYGVEVVSDRIAVP